MKKVVILFVIVCAVITLSACNKQVEQNMQSEQQGAEISKESEGGMLSGSIKDLLSMDKSQKCTWSEEGTAKGVVYIDGEKIRSESQNAMMDQEGQSGDALMINDGDWIYTWDSATKQGMKIKNEEMSLEDIKSDEESMGEMDVATDMEAEMDFMSETYDYKCEKWKVDANMFVPPTDVQFQDMNVMLEQVQNMAGELAGMCDFFEGAEKDECLANMQSVSQ